MFTFKMYPSGKGTQYDPEVIDSDSDVEVIGSHAPVAVAAPVAPVVAPSKGKGTKRAKESGAPKSKRPKKRRSPVVSASASSGLTRKERARKKIKSRVDVFRSLLPKASPGHIPGQIRAPKIPPKKTAKKKVSKKVHESDHSSSDRSGSDQDRYESDFVVDSDEDEEDNYLSPYDPVTGQPMDDYDPDDIDRDVEWRNSTGQVVEQGEHGKAFDSLKSIARRNGMIRATPQTEKEELTFLRNSPDEGILMAGDEQFQCVKVKDLPKIFSKSKAKSVKSSSTSISSGPSSTASLMPSSTIDVLRQRLLEGIHTEEPVASSSSMKVKKRVPIISTIPLP